MGLAILSSVQRDLGSCGLVGRVARLCAAAFLGAAATVAVTAGVPGQGALPLAHAAETPCRNDQVTVVVAGQGTGCATAGTTGWDALVEAGFSVTPVSRFPGMICRIGGAPASADCSDAPPVDAYWAYYHAPLGGSWNYSQLGAAAYTTQAGTVEGWAFGAGAQPGAVPERKASANTGGGHSGTSHTEEGTDPLSMLPPADGGADDNGDTGARPAPSTGANGRGQNGSDSDAERGADRDGRNDEDRGSRGTERDGERNGSEGKDADKNRDRDGDTADKGSSDSKDGKDADKNRDKDSAKDSDGVASPSAQAAESGGNNPDAAAMASNKEEGNGWLPVVGVLAVILALAGAGVAVAKRRRVQDSAHGGEF